MIEHPPLRARQAERLHAPVEGGAHQTGDVVQDEAEIARQVFAEHGQILPQISRLAYYMPGYHRPHPALSSRLEREPKSYTIMHQRVSITLSTRLCGERAGVRGRPLR